jgi:hypothetical protein
MRRAQLQAVSLGESLDVDTPSRGVVHSVYRRAVNLTLGAELWTLLTEDRADLPFGIRVALPGYDELALRHGETVNVRASFVGIGSRIVVDCRMARRWAPTPVFTPQAGLKRRLAIVAAATAGRSWHGSAAMAAALRTAFDDATSLQAVLAKVVGCGPGATPSGDDVLVGTFAVLTLPHAGKAGTTGADLLGRLLLPMLPRTTDVSGHLLRQAARGMFSRDVHELVAGLLGATSMQDLQEKVRRVLGSGATSGADLCEGVLAFAPSFFLTHSKGDSP